MTGQYEREVRMKRTIGRMMLAVGLATSLLAAGTAASAKAGDVVRTGACSGASDWKLKLSPDNGQIRARVRGRPEQGRGDVGGSDQTERHAHLRRQARDEGAERIVHRAVARAEPRGNR
jgi:hypothetical protein